MGEFPGMGDMPQEDIYWFVREGFPQLLKVLQKPTWKDELSNLLLKFGEHFSLAPQNVVPAFAKPFKETGETIELPPAPGVVAETFYDRIRFQIPPGHAGVVTGIHHELEATGAYADVNVRIFYRSQSDQWWRPSKPEIDFVRICLFHEEWVTLQFENNSTLMSHYAWAEIFGYVWPVAQHDKSQQGLTPQIK